MLKLSCPREIEEVLYEHPAVEEAANKAKILKRELRKLYRGGN
jgi:hypothetical protein